jgi:DNA-directed RNA polymerase
VSEAKAHGVTAFAMIHDSYGSHATDIPLLARVTRETFTRLYRDDVLADLAAQFTQQVTDAEELPEVPQRGTLDLNALGMADYFFA